MPAISERRRPWWVLIGTCLALFVLMLDSTEVVLALPVMARELDLSPPGLQWVQNAYLLVLAAAVVTCGRLGDILGRRRVFIAGLAVFVAGAVLAAVSQDEGVMIAARSVQGLGAAAMFALSLAIASNAFPPERQAMAVGVWAAVSSVALGIGPLLGGILVDGAGWRWIFWTYLPFCAAAAVILAIAEREERDPAARRVDGPGLVTVSLGLGLVVLAIVQADAWGFPSVASISVLVAGLISLAVFRWVEGRRADALVDFELFRNRPFFGASVAALAIVGSYWTMMFFEPQFLQGALGHSVIASGVLVLPITVPLVFLSPLAGRWMERVGARRFLVAGLLAAATAIAAIAVLGRERTYVAVFVPYLLYGIALGLLYAPVSSAAMAAMPREKSGIAAGVLGMQRLVAGAVVLALSGGLYQALDDDPGFSVDAVEAALLVPTALLVIGAVAAWRLLGEHRPRHSPRIEHHRGHY